MRYVGDDCCLFISVFHSSKLLKFVARYGVMFGRCKSTIGSKVQFCVSRFKFNQRKHENNIIIRQHCFSLRDAFCFGVVQFMRESITLRDYVDKSRPIWMFFCRV